MVSGRRYQTACVVGFYVVLTIAVTWPLITQLRVAVPQTLLDPL
jgi:hypothetical protein